MRKKRIFIGFLIYGIVVGLLSTWWWQISDSLFLPNLPGQLLGDEVYVHAINSLGNPQSAQAHYTIPWGLRIPQVYVPVSIIFWGLVGLIIQIVHNRLKRKR